MSDKAKRDKKRKQMGQARSKVHAAFHNIRTVGDLQYFADQMYRQGVRDATERTTNDRIIMLLWTLHDKFRWNSKERMEKLLKESNELTEAINKKLVSTQDLIKALDEECGLKITFK